MNTAEIETLLSKTTPGDWKVCKDESFPDEPGHVLVCCGPGEEHAGPVVSDQSSMVCLTTDDAKWIAASRPIATALMARIAELEAQVERLRALVEQAYREGWRELLSSDDGRELRNYEDSDWNYSDAKKALEALQ